MNLQVFLDDFMNVDDLNLLAKDLYELFDCPVMVVDVAFRALAWHRPADFADRTFQGSIERGSLTYETGSFLVSADARQPAQARYVTLRDSPYRRRFSPLITGGVLVGYLILVDIHDDLHTREDALFAAVESALAKQLRMDTHRGSLLTNTEESVLSRLLDGSFASEDLFRLQAEAAGLDYFAPRRFALVNFELYRSTNWSENALRSTILSLFPRSKPLIYNGSLLFFLNSEPDAGLFRDLSRRFGLRIVISAPMERLFDLPGAYAATREIMECLLPRIPHAFAVLAEPYHALMMLRHLSARSDLILPAVKALAASDASEQTLYCHTLYAYLACHHSLQQTSAMLFTHRNTVLYRIRRMKEDYGIPVDDPAQHLALLLSAALALLALGQEALFIPEQAETGRGEGDF